MRITFFRAGSLFTCAHLYILAYKAVINKLMSNSIQFNIYVINKY